VSAASRAPSAVPRRRIASAPWPGPFAFHGELLSWLCLSILGEVGGNPAPMRGTAALVRCPCSPHYGCQVHDAADAPCLPERASHPSSVPPPRREHLQDTNCYAIPAAWEADAGAPWLTQDDPSSRPRCRLHDHRCAKPDMNSFTYMRSEADCVWQILCEQATLRDRRFIGSQAAHRVILILQDIEASTQSASIRTGVNEMMSRFAVWGLRAEEGSPCQAHRPLSV
jgi:hypothetical protein